MLVRGIEIEVVKRLTSGFKVSFERLAEVKTKSAPAAPLVDPVILPANRTIPLERRPTMAAPCCGGLARDRRELAHSPAVPAANEREFRGSVSRGAPC